MPASVIHRDGRSNPADAAYQASLFVQWAVEVRGILVIDEPGQRSLRLEYPAAGIWELLMQGREVREVVEMAAWFADVPPADVPQLVDRLIEEWASHHWIVPRRQ